LQEQSALQTRTSRASSRSKAASSSVNKSQQKALDEMKKQGRGKSKKDDAMVREFFSNNLFPNFHFPRS
jgi:ABC-type transporter MlaC component